MSLDLIKEIPNLPQLIESIDKFTRYRDQEDAGGYFVGKQRAFAASNFGGYVNPLIVAINERRLYPKRGIEIVRFLLDAGADPDAVDLFHRQSPLFVAAYNGDYEAVSLLLDFGATQNGYSNEDKLLIHDGFLSDSPKRLNEVWSTSSQRYVNPLHSVIPNSGKHLQLLLKIHSVVAHLLYFQSRTHLSIYHILARN
jgi:hypothetical protein